MFNKSKFLFISVDRPERARMFAYNETWWKI